MHSFAFHLFVLVSGLLSWLLGMFDDRLKATVAPPLLALVAGVALGIVIPQPRDQLLELLETVSWFAVGFGVVSIALRFEGPQIRSIWRVGLVVTALLMASMWAVSTWLVIVLFAIPFKLALLVAAIITPTDPVVASSIVTGPFARKHIPERLRKMLSFESGINDGLAYAFVFLAITLIEQPGSAGWTHWFLKVVLWQVLAAGAIGAAAGWAAGRVGQFAIARGFVDNKVMLVLSMAFTVMALGLLKSFSVDSIWAVFVAAIGFSSLVPGDQHEATHSFQEGATYLAMVPALLLFGMAIPWSDWNALGLVAVAFVAAVLALRRLPAVALLYAVMRRDTLPTDALLRERHPFFRPRDMWFYGWFGPIGLSGIFYATTAHRHLDDPRIWALASLCIFGSIVVHGLSAAWGTRLYARAATARESRTSGTADA